MFLLMLVTHLLDPDEAMEVSKMLSYELAMKQSTTQEHFSRLLCLYIYYISEITTSSFPYIHIYKFYLHFPVSGNENLLVITE